MKMTDSREKNSPTVSSLCLILLGTGDAGGVPVYGCECPACRQAHSCPEHIRKPCCAVLQSADDQLLIDAGLTDLAERFPPGELSGILLTHFHPDHVQGLFHLRWGVAPPINVWCPPDLEGCADLYKNNGLLRFNMVTPFESFQLRRFTITPVPLIHSRVCFGYCIDDGKTRITYLTDTRGLPQQTVQFLRAWQPVFLVLDCTYPPQKITPRNHNDLTQALEIFSVSGAKYLILTHISHEFDTWLLTHRDTLPGNVVVGYDHLIVSDHPTPCIPFAKQVHGKPLQD